MADQLATFTAVDLATQWQNEPADLTPWLFDNLDILASEIGIELDGETIEKQVGRYFADIVARDSNGDIVVIENQLGSIDHDHVGKAITYAGCMNAKTIIWIARDFTPEHLMAIEWLSSNLKQQGIALYAVKIELWRIDNSRPAISFNVLNKNIEIPESVVLHHNPETLTELKRIQYDFWEQFRAALIDKKVLIKPRQAKPRYWFDIPLGKAGIHISCTASPQKNKIGVRVYIQKKIAIPVFEELFKYKQEIESSMGEALTWDPNSKAQDKIILLEKELNFSNHAAWPDGIAWMIDRVGKVRKTFIPIIKKLNIETMPEDDDEPDEDSQAISENE